MCYNGVVPIQDVVNTVFRETDAGRSIALCAIVATRGSTPQPAGSMVTVDEAARMTGTLGGGCVEADIRRQAHEVLSAGKSADEPDATTGRVVTFQLDHDFGYDDGMICGGQIDVAIGIVHPSADITPYTEALGALRGGRAASVPVRVITETGPVEYRILASAAPELVIVGGGHIGRILAGMTAPLGFNVHVVDDRSEYLGEDRFPPPIQTRAGDIAETLRDWPLTENTYVVTVTRGHKHDEIALEAVLNRPAKYIGMIGSRRKVAVIFDDLRHKGFDEEQIERVQAPIGVPIGAVTTEEIALSIAAQLVSVRRAERHKAVEGPFPIADDQV